MTLAETAKVPNLVNIALQGIAQVYTFQHDYRVALSFLERVSRPTGQSRQDQLSAARLDAAIGNVYLRLKRPEARAVLERSVATARDRDDRNLEAWVLQRLAEMDQATEPQLARERYQSAADYYGSIGDLLQQSSALLFVARADTRAQRWDRAIAAAQAAIEAARQADVPMYIGSGLDELGRALRGAGRTVEAAAAFEEATSWMEAQRSQMIGDEMSGANFLTDRAAPYTSLMDLRAQDGDTLAAIGLAEQVRARSLLDALAAGKVDPEAELTPAEKDREQTLSRTAARWNAELSRPAPARDVRDRFEKAARDLESYRNELYAAHARLKARRGQAEPITREALLTLVPDAKTLLVEYAFSETGGWAFTVARGIGDALELHATRLTTARADLEKRVDAFRRSLATRDLSFAPQARQLYRDLLAPIEAQLKGRTSISIAPDAALWNLPFHALIGPDGKYLIERASVSYEPSLTALHGSVRVRPAVDASRKSLLALATGTPDLPNATEEIRQLARLYGPAAVAVVGPDATEQRWKRDADGFRVLHLATHGILNGANPLYSYLQLRPGGPDDGMLEAREILGATLHAELVVLSACETGRGEVVGGEGLVGLSWAALGAGVPTVVVSQWKVDATSTTQLMLAFHRAIAAASTKPGPIRGKAQALRAAELVLIRTPQFSHPFYWAAFEMLGDGS